MCFSSDTELLDVFNDPIRVDKLKKGDMLRYGHVIQCVVKYQVEGAWVCRFNQSMGITPFHPIRHKEGLSCIFPRSIQECTYESHILTLYTFIMDSGHYVVTPNGIHALTLGHGYTDGVSYHPYFGTCLIINDISRMDGFQKGTVIIPKGTIFTRDNERMIDGMITN